MITVFKFGNANNYFRKFYFRKVYSRFKLAIKYCHYWFTASNGKGHGIHSPFVFQFITQVLNDNKKHETYEQVEELRNQLLSNNLQLEVEDFGAGSFASAKKNKTIASIARHAAKPKKFGQLLFRIAKKYQPKTIVELGTSLGISTCYLSLANRSASIFTLEGSESIAAIAKNNFEKIGAENCKQVLGNFDSTLQPVLNQIETVDLCFLDGNHRKVPTENYFNQLLTKKNSNSIFILDDIHWSKGMESAWEIIKNNPEVRCTIDLFFIGIVFFKHEIIEPQHFKIRF